MTCKYYRLPLQVLWGLSYYSRCCRLRHSSHPAGFAEIEGLLVQPASKLGTQQQKRASLQQDSCVCSYAVENWQCSADALAYHVVGPLDKICGPPSRTVDQCTAWRWNRSTPFLWAARSTCVWHFCLDNCFYSARRAFEGPAGENKLNARPLDFFLEQHASVNFCAGLLAHIFSPSLRQK